MKNEALQKTLINGLMHGLKGKRKDGGDTMYEISSVSANGKYYTWKPLVFGDYTQSEMLPYLRDLSDLTSEITHKGETFVPTELLDSDDYHTGYTEDTEFDYVIDMIHRLDMEFLPNGLVQQFIEWNFNVFDLKPNEYIKVTEENNPYKTK